MMIFQFAARSYPAPCPSRSSAGGPALLTDSTVKAQYDILSCIINTQTRSCAAQA